MANNHPEDVSQNGVRKPDSESLKWLIPPEDPVCRKLPADAEIFCVGGAVRDHLLGDPVSDRDYVVVGTTVEAMISAGFMPVGKDFPVFLHPVTRDEYALARTERKSGKGYKGFVFNAAPDVSLHDDLSRRDLTINAMAVSKSGVLMDPFGGFEDLQGRLLRHIGPAFSEDPVRLLRLARFAARWPDFEIAPATLALCREIVENGEASALVAERVWQELAKGLSESKPSRMLTTLSDCGAWQAIANQKTSSGETRTALDCCAKENASLDVRFAILANDDIRALHDRFKAPKSAVELARLLADSLENISAVGECVSRKNGSSVDTALAWLDRADIYRRTDRALELLLAHQCRKDMAASEIEKIRALIGHMTDPASGQKIAQAAQAAQRNGLAVTQAVAEEKQKLLQSFLTL